MTAALQKAGAFWSRGIVHLSAQEPIRAEQDFSQALELDVRLAPRALAGIAAARGLLGRSDEAEELIAQCLIAAAELNAPTEAAYALAEAFAGPPPRLDILAHAQFLFETYPPPAGSDPFPPLFVRGALLAETDPVAGVGVLSATLRLRPKHLATRRLLFALLVNQKRFDELREALVLAPTALVDDLELTALILSGLVRSSMEDESELQAQIALWAKHRPAVPILAPVPRDPSGRRLRVGVTQTSFHYPAYWNVLTPTLMALAANLDVIAYQFGEDLVAPPAPLDSTPITWRNLGGLDRDAAAALIAADQLDVLLNLEGLSSSTPLDVYRRRPAPVVASTYNTLCSLGPGVFDWVVADTVVLSSDAEAGYAERIARLKAPYYYGVFTKPNDAPEPAPTLDAPPTLGGYCQSWKISPACARAWAQILAARPDARLILRTPDLSDAVSLTRLSAQLVAAGVPLARVTFDGAPLPYADHLQRYDLIDVLLDPFPFQGPSTVSEALWMGVPVASRMGERWAARLGASLVIAADYPDYAAQDDDAYVRLALDLLDAAPARRDPAVRLAQRARVAASPLCDQEGYGRAMEAALRMMAEDAWRRSN